MEPPPKRRKLDHPNSENDALESSVFLKPKPYRRPRVGDNFQAPIPSLSEPSQFGPSNLQEQTHKPLPSPPEPLQFNNILTSLRTSESLPLSGSLAPSVPSISDSTFPSPSLPSPSLFRDELPTPTSSQRFPLVVSGLVKVVPEADLRRIFLEQHKPRKTKEEHIEELRASLPEKFLSLSDEDLLSFFPILRKPPKCSRVGDTYQATVIPELVEDYPSPDPVRVGETCVLKQIPEDLEQRRTDRDAQRTKADKVQNETKESEMALQSLYQMDFGEDDESDDEEFEAEPTEILHVIDKKLDWLPGDPENSARDIVLVLYRSGQRAWKYPKEIEEFSHLIELFDEEHGLKEEEAYDGEGEKEEEQRLSDIDVEALKLETQAVMEEMNAPPPVLPNNNPPILPNIDPEKASINPQLSHELKEGSKDSNPTDKSNEEQ